MPIGDWEGDQDLVVARKKEDGTLSQKTILPVQFVPMTGAGVWTVRQDPEDEKG